MEELTSTSVPTSLDSAELGRLTAEQVGTWLRRRLHGDDTLAPLEPRLDEYRHSLFRDLYLEQAGEFRRALRAAVRTALEDALRPVLEKWSDPSARIELFMLVPDIANDADREGLVTTAKLLQAAVPSLPWRVPGPHGSQLRVRLHGLIALVELDWHKIPLDYHPPMSFWTQLWEPTVTEPSDPVYGYAGEQAALIFEGIEKTQFVGESGAPDRHQRLTAALRWLGAARPRREQYLLSAFKSLLPSLLGRIPADDISTLLEKETLPHLVAVITGENLEVNGGMTVA